MVELFLITKEGSTKEILGALDQAADRVKTVSGLLAYRVFEVSGRKRKSKKKKFERYERKEKEDGEQESTEHGSR